MEVIEDMIVLVTGVTLDHYHDVPQVGVTLAQDVLGMTLEIEASVQWAEDVVQEDVTKIPFTISSRGKI